MSTGQTTDARNLLWALVDARAGKGIKSRSLLQDAVFLGQEVHLLPRTFDFPVWPGIGTARYSSEVGTCIDALLRLGHIYDTGGPSSLKAAHESPQAARDAVRSLAEKLLSTDDRMLSMMAAFLMARRREQADGIRGDAALRAAAASRLGWSDALRNQVERALEEFVH